MNFYRRAVEIQAFLEIGLKFLEDVAFYADLGMDSHGVDVLPHFSEAVYDLLRLLETGVAKDEQIGTGLQRRREVAPGEYVSAGYIGNAGVAFIDFHASLTEKHGEVSISFR